MNRWSLRAVVLTSLVVSGCTSESSKMLEAQEAFADEACACKDAKCIQSVHKKQRAWIKEHGATAVGSESDLEKIEAANKRLMDCVTKAGGSGG